LPRFRRDIVEVVRNATCHLPNAFNLSLGQFGSANAMVSHILADKQPGEQPSIRL
jgi:hypothetical protein